MNPTHLGRSVADLAHHFLHKPPEQLDEEERRVLDSITSGTFVSRDAGDVSDERASFGDRLADRVAGIGGSWGFVFIFGAVLGSWMLINSEMLRHLAPVLDPFPYTLLNLTLSTLAAVQAPFIMMSQNRQAEKDRLSASLDYETNLRAEIDILQLHQKLDAGVIERLAALEAKIDALAAAAKPG